MIYKIYPVSEKKWLDTFKRIKTICKLHKMQITEIDVVPVNECSRIKNSGWFSPDEFVTVIKVAQQGSLQL